MAIRREPDPFLEWEGGGGEEKGLGAARCMEARQAAVISVTTHTPHVTYTTQVADVIDRIDSAERSISAVFFRCIDIHVFYCSNKQG